MSLKIALDKFGEEFNKAWNRYIELDKQLLAYRGVEINKDNIEPINAIVVGLQDTYAELHESLYFINSWSSNALLLINEHKKFMDDIKSAGGVPDKKVEKVNEAEA